MNLPCPENFFIPLWLFMKWGAWYIVACMYGVTLAGSYPKFFPFRERNNLIQFTP